MGDLGSFPGLGRSPGEENGYPLQYSCLENDGQRILEGYSPQSHKESDTTEQLSLSNNHKWQPRPAQASYVDTSVHG